MGYYNTHNTHNIPHIDNIMRTWDNIHEVERKEELMKDTPNPADNTQVAAMIANMPAKTKVINSIGQAIGQVKSAYDIGVTANPMAADLSVFQELMAINKKLSECMLAINKLRGL